MFEFTYDTRYGDYKDFDTIKTAAILDIIQDVSIRDSHSRGYGIHDMRDMNLAWLMQGIDVRFLKPVRTLDKIEVGTAVAKMRGVTSERGCVLKQNGEIVAKSVALWFLLDAEKGRPTRIPQQMLEVYDVCDFEDDFFKYEKPAVIEEAEKLYSIRVGARDIDTNGHLNNVKAAELLMEALPTGTEFNSLEMLYKKEAYEKEILNVFLAKTEKGYNVQLRNEADEICVVGDVENL